ncbi:MAG: hypothetical protein H6624_16870 [Bdellovibrionaceae bacterium]|nr:hypothetical protein [Bdellovibrionales bacterium]MCB9086019.1 hypothetical protein [Pseudobdellovibrionaceae bacterium]
MKVEVINPDFVKLNSEKKLKKSAEINPIVGFIKKVLVGCGKVIRALFCLFFASSPEQEHIQKMRYNYALQYHPL